MEASIAPPPQGVEAILRLPLSQGIIAGFPVLGMTARLVDGAYHDVDSSVMAFEIAGRAACREGLRKAGVRLLGWNPESWDEGDTSPMEGACMPCSPRPRQPRGQT